MAGYNITGISTADCPACETWAELADTTLAAGQCQGNQDSGACDETGSPVPSYLPRVAWYLKNLDFRSDSEIGADGFPFEKKQTLTTYTIGLGTRGAATEILKHTAEAGGGLFNGGTGADVADAKTLKDAIMRVLEDVNTRSTSFGAASLSTLQVATTQGVLVPRFEPARSAHWDGHLFAFDLFSEFTSGACKPAAPATSGPLNGDYDCDGKCGSVFLKDRDGDFIQEDGTGAFKKSQTRDRAPCGGGSRCTIANCSGPDLTSPAEPFWDAGAKLAPVKVTTDPVSGIKTEQPNPDHLAWNRRKIFTVIDRTGDGKLTAADAPLVSLQTVDPATLVPYLNIKGSRFCGNVAQRLTSRGNPEGAAIDLEGSTIQLDPVTLQPVLDGSGAPIPKTPTYRTCAKMILYFVRGADIFDERRGDSACASYPGTYCTRKYQLGDIFHSSPDRGVAPARLGQLQLPPRPPPAVPPLALLELDPEPGDDRGERERLRRLREEPPLQGPAQVRAGGRERRHAPRVRESSGPTPAPARRSGRSSRPTSSRS